MKERLAAGLAVLVFTVLPAAAQKQPLSTVGHWHVDFEQSIDPWAAHPKSVVLNVIVDDEAAYESKETVVGLDGKTRTETIRAAYDGKPYSIEGSLLGITVSMKHLATGAQRIELNTPDGFHALIVCSLSADRNTMTCDETDTGPKGVSKLARSVYVRD